MDKMMLNPEWVEAKIQRIAQSFMVDEELLRRQVALAGLKSSEEDVIRGYAARLQTAGIPNQVLADMRARAQKEE